MTLRLQLIERSSVPLEVDEILPEKLFEKSIGEIEKMPVQYGNRKAELAEFFRVSGEATDQCLEWEGDLTGVHWIGAKMQSGSVHVCGSAGRHVGSQMRGGQIRVDGDVGDWVGAEMAGGKIQVLGRAGHQVAAAYRGSPRGMTGGTVLVHGDAGNEIGHSMRRGLVAIGGDASDLIGFNMLAGSILVFGNCGIRHGAGMRRGTIGLFGSERYEPLSTFRHACRCQPVVMRLFARTLEREQFPWPDDLLDAEIDLFNGDFLNDARGELLIRAA